jgi:uncharacterized ion transporter superfamily protein YfcC|tara:strand:- start:40 stop:426 length:387 start_codon:yes stop_codon:yes gene_type:complete
MFWSLLPTLFKTGSEIFKNRQATKIAMSQAQLLHAEKMKRGDIEYSGKIIENQKGDWKDEFVLLILSSPLVLLAYSIFAEDEDIGKKLDLYFEKLDGMPWWITGLWISVVAAIYGIKATDIINTKKGK